MKSKNRSYTFLTITYLRKFDKKKLIFMQHSLKSYFRNI